MGNQIKLGVSQYQKGLKTILKDFDKFTDKHDLEEVDIELERQGHHIIVTWLIFCEEVDSIQELYQDYIRFEQECDDEVELVEVCLDEGEFLATYEIKRTYLLE